MKRIFAIVGVALLLAGCAGSAPPLTGNVSTDVTAYQAYLQAGTAQLNTDLALVGKDACGVANNLNAVYTGPLGQIAVQVGSAAVTAAGAPIAAAALDVSEAAVFKEVQTGCAVIDAASAADATSPTAAELAAANTLINDVPKLQAAIAKVSPTAAALLAPPVPAVAAPAAPAAAPASI